MTPGGSAARALLAGSYAVFERDFLVATSRRRFIVMRFLCIALLSALVVLWPGMLTRFSSNLLRDPSIMGRQVFGVATVALPILLTFLAPAIAATAIVTERTLRTLPIVLTTPVHPFTFLLAKFLSRVGAVMVFVLGALPPAALCFLFGGVSVIQFLDFLILCTGISVFSVSVGILVSTFAKRTASAVLTTYGITIFGQFVVAALLSWTLSGNNTVSMEDVSFVIPLFQWIALISSGAAGTETSLPFLGVMVGVSVLSLLLAGWRLAREGGPPGEERARRGRRCRPARFANPVLDHALRGTLLNHPRGGTFGMLVVVLLAAFGALALGTSANDLDREWPYYLGMLVTSAVVAFRALAAGSHAIAEELQTGALDLLMATRLRLDEIVRGKAIGIVAETLPYLAIPFVIGLGASVSTERMEFLGVLAWLGATVSVTALFGSIGLWFSARNATPGKATLRAFAFTVGGMILHGVSFVAVASVLFRSVDDDSFMFWLLLQISPGISLISTTLFAQNVARDTSIPDGLLIGFCCGMGYLVLYVLLARGIVHGLPARIRKNLERGDF